MRISDWSSDVCSSDLISKRAPRRVSHPQSNLFAVEGKSGPDLREKQRGAWTPVRRARLNARRVARGTGKANNRSRRPEAVAASDCHDGSLQDETLRTLLLDGIGRLIADDQVQPGPGHTPVIFPPPPLPR